MNTNICKKCGKQCHKSDETKIKVNASEVGISEVVVCHKCECENCVKENRNEF